MVTLMAAGVLMSIQTQAPARLMKAATPALCVCSRTAGATVSPAGLAQRRLNSSRCRWPSWAATAEASLRQRCRDDHQLPRMALHRSYRPLFAYRRSPKGVDFWLYLSGQIPRVGDTVVVTGAAGLMPGRCSMPRFARCGRWRCCSALGLLMLLQSILRITVYVQSALHLYAASEGRWWSEVEPSPGRGRRPHPHVGRRGCRETFVLSNAK